MAKVKVKIETYYTPTEIAEQGLFPWITHEKSVRMWLAKMFELGKAKKYGIVRAHGGKGDAKHGIRYRVSQAGISKIRASFDDGSLFGGK